MVKMVEMSDFGCEFNPSLGRLLKQAGTDLHETQKEFENKTIFI